MSKVNLDKKASIKQLKRWLGFLDRWGGVVVQEKIEDRHFHYQAQFCTSRYKYSIAAREGKGRKSYLGCIVSERFSIKGNDLADGPLTKGTWFSILEDIVSYEMGKKNV